MAPYEGHLHGHFPCAGFVFQSVVICLKHYGPPEDTGRGSFREGLICSHQTNPVGSGGQCKPQSTFHKCIDGTFSLKILGQSPHCLLDCSSRKIPVYLLLD